MKNIITATIEFSFKGNRFSPSITIELDTYMRPTGCVPNFYPLIATRNNIDLYSYEYEMMQAEPIKISQIEGLVENYVVNGILDKEAFEIAWQEQQVLKTIQEIITQHELAHVVQQHPELEDALIKIYKAGESNNK